MAFTITSQAFIEGGRIPAEFTCDGANTPPPIALSDPPHGVKSYALIMNDPDAPSGRFTHWLAYDMPAGTTSLETGRAKTLPNDFGRAGYGGPCPPRGHGSHRYEVTVYALDVPSLSLSGRTREDLDAALEAHTLAKARLTGRYERRREPGRFT
jgi:Raf kinase inhibitor-like YbhB/YbcL family protein